jgi:flavin-dependent dehydrogenase
MIDVLVVGGGPVGLATAIHCALAGLSVTVAEPRAAPIDKACGEGVMPAAVRRLAALGVTPDGHPLRGIRYLDGRHQADAPFRNGNGIGVRRTALHAALASRAAALDIPVLPTRVTAFERDAGHVTAAGVEARYLVAADGLHSTIRRMLDGGRPAVRGAAVQGGAPHRTGPGSRGSAGPRYGLRRHFSVAPWTDLVEVHWTARAEAYVTPVSGDVVSIGLLFARPRRDRSQEAGLAGVTASEATASEVTASEVTASEVTARDGMRDDTGRDFEARLSAFPALLDRLRGASPASEVRGAGPMRQDVRRRVDGRVLLVGDASGYLDALTGEGIGVGLAQAEVLARCLAAGHPADYERAWRRVSGPAWRFTAGLLWSRNQPLLGPRIVPAAQRLPWLFSTLVNHAAQA